jgi:hypothetical protein
VKVWKGGGPETPCGRGSTLAYTATLIPQLEQLFSRCRVRTLVDAGCGDFHWMARVKLGGMRYIGLDLNPPKLINIPGREFRELDITRHRLPAGDLMLCRDCLFHQPLAAAGAFLRAFVSSGTPLLLLTSHPGAANVDMPAPGGFAPRDFEAAPFGLPEPVERLRDYPAGDRPRFLCLWTRAQVRAQTDQR